MTPLAATPAPFLGSGPDPLSSLLVAGFATLALAVWLVRYASRRAREERERERRTSGGGRP